jgi:hypothetical protein
MCQCTPEIRTPYCGKGSCQWPEEKSKTEATKITLQRKWAEQAARDYHKKHDPEFAIGHLAGQMKRQEMIESLVASYCAERRDNSEGGISSELAGLRDRIKGYGVDMLALRPVQ